MANDIRSSSTGKRVLIVDDEAAIRDSMKLILQGRFDIDTAGDGQQALNKIKDSIPDVIVLDVMMPTLGGIETLRQLRAQGIATPVIMLSAAQSVKNAVEAMKLGAVDFVEKPFEVEQLAGLLETVSQPKPPGSKSSQASVAATATAVPLLDASQVTPPVLIGNSPTMLQLRELIAQVAPCDATVLITGESGTGKEVVARTIHSQSRRTQGPFVAINCAAIPETLIESELFGHERGAFTHALESRMGLCELADGGTLFLDEIGELSPPVQVKLLRFLQEQEFYRVGSTKPIRVSVRIVAATNKDLERLIAEKRFREDLYYRLHVVQVHLAPLRDKLEDLDELIQYFISKLSPTYGGKQLTFSPAVMQSFAEYLWPGNVRELENLVESLLALVDTSVDSTVTVAHLPAKLAARSIASDKTPEKMESQGPAGNVSDDGSKSARAALSDSISIPISRDDILRALKRANYALPRAAELLGVSRRILRYQMDKLGIPDVPPH